MIKKNKKTYNFIYIFMINKVLNFLTVKKKSKKEFFKKGFLFKKINLFDIFN